MEVKEIRKKLWNHPKQHWMLKMEVVGMMVRGHVYRAQGPGLVLVSRCPLSAHPADWMGSTWCEARDKCDEKANAHLASQRRGSVWHISSEVLIRTCEHVHWKWELNKMAGITVSLEQLVNVSQVEKCCHKHIRWNSFSKNIALSWRAGIINGKNLSFNNTHEYHKVFPTKIFPQKGFSLAFLTDCPLYIGEVRSKGKSFPDSSLAFEYEWKYLRDI